MTKANQTNIFVEKVIRSFFYLLGFIAIAGSLLGYGAKYNLYLEAITNFKPQFLLLSIVCLPYFWVNKKYICLALITGTFCVNAFSVIPSIFLLTVQFQ